MGVLKIDQLNGIVLSTSNKWDVIFRDGNNIVELDSKLIDTVTTPNFDGVGIELQVKNNIKLTQRGAASFSGQCTISMFDDDKLSNTGLLFNMLNQFYDPVSGTVRNQDKYFEVTIIKYSVDNKEVLRITYKRCYIDKMEFGDLNSEVSTLKPSLTFTYNRYSTIRNSGFNNSGKYQDFGG